MADTENAGEQGISRIKFRGTPDELAELRRALAEHGVDILQETGQETESDGN